MNIRFFFVVALWLASATAGAQKANISLAGTWHVQLDPDSTGVERQSFNTLGGAPIALPGTLDQAGYGTPTHGADYGILSRKHQYIGPAWYNRWIEIPTQWGERAVELHLERVMWQSQVWIDGRPAGTQDGLGTPHRHTLGRLKPGRHLLSVRMNNDMIHRIGDKGHSYGAYTQIIWNGMVGSIELRPIEALHVGPLEVWPEASKNRVRVSFSLAHSAPNHAATVRYTIKEYPSGKTIYTTSGALTLGDTTFVHTAYLTPTAPIKRWDEFTPNLYTIEVAVGRGTNASVQHSTFGFRDLSTQRSKIVSNGNPLFLRGNLDCVHFPLTGYPSCDVREWERIFTIYKEHGLNHVRFHSWCPPEAAFQAADRLGIYIQAEVLWIDWWMSVVNKNRPEMTTRGLPPGLGHNPSADAFVPAELHRMVEAYGNHPSFALMCIGNELGNSDFTVMQSWIEAIQKKDNRRLYSVSTARTITPVDQFMVTHNIPNVGVTYGLNGKGTDFDLESHYAQAPLPIVAHELGQFPVYPLWSEIDKYTGVLEARNLIELKKLAEKNQLLGMDSLFHQASGALQTLLYKALLENLFRTPSCAGFSMLSMTDYSGQGEALIGWLDSFWEQKNIVAPSEFRRYSNSVVLLARFPKYIWQSGERFSAEIQTANYTPRAIDEPVHWSVQDAQGTPIGQGTLEQRAESGTLNSIGTIELSLPAVQRSEQLTLTLRYPKSGIENQWRLWLFAPAEPQAKEVWVAEQLDDVALDRLEQGGKVLLLAHRLGRPNQTTPLHFTPLFWSSSFFPGQSNKTLGLYIDHKHPALAGFPTDSHTDWQWESLCTGRSFDINRHPSLRPIVQPISDFHLNHRLASIFECRVGRGKLLVSGHDLTGDQIEAKTLKSSLLSYMNSEAFAPSYAMERDTLRAVFYAPPTAPNVLPRGFEEAVLYTTCGALSAPQGASPWSPTHDQIHVQQSGCGYTVRCDNTWRDSQGTAWTGREITVEIDTPNGILCDLYVRFEDWNQQGRQGVVSIEGRESTLGASDDKGQWIKLLVMREDTNDGKITLKAHATQGGNLMIGQLALVKTK